MIRTAEALIDFLAAVVGKKTILVKTGPRMLVEIDRQIFSIEVKWEGDTRRND